MTEKTIEDRVSRIETAVFASKDDWPTGHTSMQAQLDELFKLYDDLRVALRETQNVIVEELSKLGERGNSPSHE
jgi:hypothetical protein